MFFFAKRLRVGAHLLQQDVCVPCSQHAVLYFFALQESLMKSSCLHIGGLQCLRIKATRCSRKRSVLPINKQTKQDMLVRQAAVTDFQ